MSTPGGPQNLPQNLPQSQPNWRGCVVAMGALLGLFAGLCTLFALAVTVYQAWQEHAQAQWPEATAQVQRCGLDMYSRKTRSYFIDCRVSYEIVGDLVVTHVHSLGRPASQNQSPQLETMRDWVDDHPPGTSIPVRYDPANHNQAVLVTTDMPLGGPKTPNNLKLLGAAATSCVVLLTIAWIARPRSAAASARR